MIEEINEVKYWREAGELIAFIPIKFKRRNGVRKIIMPDDAKSESTALVEAVGQFVITPALSIDVERHIDISDDNILLAVTLLAIDCHGVWRSADLRFLVDPVKNYAAIATKGGVMRQIAGRLL